MKKTDAFISFSFEDQDIVENVVNELENKYGLSCWTCIKYVKSGQSYKELIPVAIKKSCVTVVFISKDSVVSTQVPKEVGIALKREKTVIPFLLDNSEYQGRLEYDLEGVNYIDATKDPFDERVKDLAKAICFAANKPFDFEDASDVTQKEADNPQIKNEDITPKHSVIKSVFINLLNALIFIFPLVLQLINYYYPVLVKSLPSVLGNIYSVFLNNWVFLLYYIVATIIVYFHFTDFDYQKKEYGSVNIDSDFSGSFQSFINKLTTLCSTNLALKQTDKHRDLSDKFAISYDFDRIKTGSVTGKRVDYFSVVYPIYTNPFCRFFYIGRHTSKKNAVKYLVKQGFNFCEKNDNIIHFCKNEDLHLRIAYRRFIPGILGLEVTRGNVASDLAKRISEEYEFISPKALIREFKESSKKDKFSAIAILIVLAAVAACICGLAINAERKDTVIPVEHTSDLSFIADSSAPVVTISEPTFNIGTVEFTVYVEEDSEFLSININDDTVETIGFTADMDVVDQGRKQILKFSDLQVDSDNCQIILLDGAAKDAENNTSAECSSEMFSLDTQPPRIASIRSTNKDSIIKEGDTAIYNVVFYDNIGIAALYINPDENIVTHGFVADISIKKTNSAVREITFSNIKFNDSDEKYFMITEGVVADVYGNMNEPSHKIYLKTE